MSQPLTPEQLAELRRFSTPTVCNAIEMFDVRRRTDGFMRPGLECRFPELGVIVGYAATATSRAARPAGNGGGVELRAYYEHIVAQPAPRILVAQDLDDPPLGALFGEVNASVHQALGCVGHITNGGVRDLDECRHIGFQFFSSCVQASHAHVHLESFGHPVEVGGIAVHPGDLIHADRHGVCLIPHEVAPEVAAACEAMEAIERPLTELARSPEATPQALAAGFGALRAGFAAASVRFRHRP